MPEHPADRPYIDMEKASNKLFVFWLSYPFIMFRRHRGIDAIWTKQSQLPTRTTRRALNVLYLYFIFHRTYAGFSVEKWNVPSFVCVCMCSRGCFVRVWAPCSTICILRFAWVVPMCALHSFGRNLYAVRGAVVSLCDKSWYAFTLLCVLVCARRGETEGGAGRKRKLSSYFLGIPFAPLYYCPLNSSRWFWMIILFTVQG